MKRRWTAARGSCSYGAECGYLEDCVCGCCLVVHECECDDNFEAGDEYLDDHEDEDAL